MSRNVKILCAVAIVLVVVLVVVRCSQTPNIDYSPDRELEAGAMHSSSETLDDFENIEIDGDVADVTVAYGDSYALDFTIYGSIDYGVTDGTLRITAKSRERWNDTMHDNTDLYITVTVPQDAALRTVDVSTDVGDIYLTDIAAETFVFDSDVGNVELTDIRGKGLEARVSVGDMIMRGTIEGNVDIQTDVGDIDLALRGSDADYDYEMASSLGNLKINGEKTEGEAERATGAPYLVKLEASTGDIDYAVE